MPVGVVFPRNTAEVSGGVEIAVRNKIPLLPRGGGSSLAGQAIGNALIMDFSRYMDKVIDIKIDEGVACVQPGVVLGNLNSVLAPMGMMFGPDPASADRATIGGVIGNNSTGAHSIVYGMTHDHVRSLEIVLSDSSLVEFGPIESGLGDAIKKGEKAGRLYGAVSGILNRYRNQISTRYPKTFRHVAGYNLHVLAGQKILNLASLIVGSEGTLGIITEAELALVQMPKEKGLAMVHFSDLRSALEAVPEILRSEPSAVEVLDKMLLDLTREKREYRGLLDFVEGDPEVVLLVEYSGENKRAILAGINELKQILWKAGHRDSVVVVIDPNQQARVWYVRKVGLGILMSVQGDEKPVPFIEDAAVPVEHLADYISEIKRFCHSLGVNRVAMYAHASAGCIHVRPLVNLKTGSGINQMRQIAEKSLELVVLYSGTTSGEHGDGIVRAEFLETLYGADLVNAFQEVKISFDPDNLMNPGKVIDPPKMDDDNLLRYGVKYETPLAIEPPIFQYREQVSFGQAIEMCNGAGVCRKLTSGVMCPSFRGTRDETHSTRGRANALRVAMMGFLGDGGMASRELYDVLDLCLSCQACRSECPSSVDVAKLKAEFLNNYYKDHGVPFKANVFGRIAEINRLGYPWRRLVNLGLENKSKLLSTLLGIEPSRELPKFSTQTFSSWYRNKNKGSQQDRRVVFFHDTFMEYNYPEIGKAAIGVLEQVGFEVILLENKKCCGRPAISKGLLGEARRLAEHNIKLLVPYAKQGIPIIGCEPSCLTTLAHEYPDLVPNEDAQIVSEMTMLIEDILVSSIEAGKFSLQFDQRDRRVLYHGHCHQKAEFGTGATVKLLQSIPGCKVEEIDAGCCGMAGSFGYEREHYQLSIKLAEEKLAPAIRSADQDVIVCASGTSCREQIKHVTGRVALHPIEVLYQAIRE
ncbi:anaerobic glycerol-3-phosphate dehydrogenase subunit C [Chloroflexota bacterium]